jgi:hypothetical protein
MNLDGWSLAEVAAAVEAQLRAYGMSVAVVGGSAITIHVPQVYTSHDIDLAVTTGINHRRIGEALAGLGFKSYGRSYANETTPYTIDIVADTPYVDQRPIHDFDRVQTIRGDVTVLKLQDAIADRIAAFLYWQDSQSLDVAERSLAAADPKIDWASLIATLEQLEHGDHDTNERFQLALEVLSKAYEGRP